MRTTEATVAASTFRICRPNQPPSIRDRAIFAAALHPLGMSGEAPDARCIRREAAILYHKLRRDTKASRKAIAG
ncbi:MAG: hypothetical protein DMG21_05355 [Acidobacteria bacterium]|nr:MAG: hypothetical protein DMG21_05355 [Acidobacteriota bacterium]